MNPFPACCNSPSYSHKPGAANVLEPATSFRLPRMRNRYHNMHCAALIGLVLSILLWLSLLALRTSSILILSITLPSRHRLDSKAASRYNRHCAQDGEALIHSSWLTFYHGHVQSPKGQVAATTIQTIQAAWHSCHETSCLAPPAKAELSLLK